MHSLGTLGADISRLLKMSGDTGDTGDKSKLCPNTSGSGVSTRVSHASPLIGQVATGLLSTGDGKSETDQRPTAVSPLSPVSPLDFEEPTVALRPTDRAMHSAHVPNEWRDGYRLLCNAAPLDNFRHDHWQSMIEDGAAFLTRWGDQAVALGWQDVDVFGVHPLAPFARIGCYGVAFLIHGGEVVAITDASATIRRPSGARLNWRRLEQNESVPVWQLLGGSHAEA